MRRLVAGIEGGQSATTAAIADLADPAVLGRASGPPADLVGEPPGSPRQRAALRTALDAALTAAGATSDDLAAVVVGLTGHDHEGTLDLGLAVPVRVVHDTVTAHAGALDGRDGIVAIVGTGSVALGTDAAGARARVGGWGHLFGDGGSAFALGRDAVALAMAADDAGEPNVLAEMLLAVLAVPDLRTIQHGVAAGTIGRPAIAALAPAVVALAEGGDAAARAILDRGAAAIARLVVDADRRLAPTGERPVALTGGLARSSPYVRRVEAAIGRSTPPRGGRFVSVRTARDGLAGALSLARDVATAAEALS